jgi:PAS domain S-box-containing protein
MERDTDRTSATARTTPDKGRLEALLSSAVDGIIVIDHNGLIATVNPAAARLFGYDVSEFIGRNVKFLMTQEHQPNHDGYLKNYNTTGHKKIIGIGREVTGRRKDGSVFPMHLSVGEFEENGEKFFTGIIHDLTQQKEAEHALRQMQKIEAVGQLTGGVAHDFNNLLMVIIGNLELLMDEPMLQKHRSQLDAIMKAAELGESLTKRLLAFARRSPLKPQPIQLNQVIADLVQMLERVIGESVTLTTSLEPEIWQTKVDPDQFRSALVNLAINARDAMPEGGSLVIETRNFHMDGVLDDALQIQLGQYVAISVTDTGCGMPQEVIEHVFEPFFTTKAVGAGTGLGLSMVYGFSKQSGGDVTIFSEPQKGTTVNLFLPRYEEGTTETAAAKPEPALAIRPRTGETILVVEDNEQVRVLARSRLEMLGYVVVEAENGQAALNILKAGTKVDLVFTDLVMPGGISGYVLTEHVHTHYPDIPVVMTSGYAEELVNSDMLTARKVKLLRKPFRHAELAQTIRDALDNRSKPAS